MSGKVFKLEKIAQCVQLLDELGASGQGTQAFAQARGLGVRSPMSHNNFHTTR
jgi:hypothetical protein